MRMPNTYWTGLADGSKCYCRGGLDALFYFWEDTYVRVSAPLKPFHHINSEEVSMKLSPETLKRHACKARERCPKPCHEKGDARRYPVHTLAPDPHQPELELVKPEPQKGRPNA